MAIVNINLTTLSITNKAIDYTAVANDLVVYDTDSADRTLTLPVAPSVDDRVGIYLQTLTGTDTIIINRNGNTIGGVAANETLYIANDFLILRYDGTSDWIIEENGLQKHIAKSNRTVAQSITVSTVTKILFDTSEYDQGGLFRLASSDFAIRRTGQYHINAIIGMALANNRVLILRLDVGGVDMIDINGTNESSLGTFKIAPLSATLNLTAGDVVFLEVFNTDSTQNTSTNIKFRPYLSITEL